MAFLVETIIALVVLGAIFGVGRIFEDEEMEYYKKTHRGHFL